VDAAQLEWQPVGSLPPGAKIAVIEGPMDQAVPFTVRAMLPANYRIPPHWHPATERVTVLSGVFHMGLGEVFDADSGHALGPGSVAIMEVGTRHYAWTEEETVIQLHGTGPWGIHYVNPEDDPRRSP
jgi:anti-sigma factor ChrR (cupin superfamily)